MSRDWRFASLPERMERLVNTTLLDDLVCELLDRYVDEEECPFGGPGLIRRLDDLRLRTGQPTGGPSSGHAAPGSRPPASLAAVTWSSRIKTEAIALDLRLRSSIYPQTWDRALRSIPAAADLVGKDDAKLAVQQVGIWHSTARTVLGLQPPALAFPYVLCSFCGGRTIYGRANQYKPRAWCTNPECADPATGQPARYDGPQLYLLARNLLTRAA